MDESRASSTMRDLPWARTLARGQAVPCANRHGCRHRQCEPAQLWPQGLLRWLPMPPQDPGDVLHRVLGREMEMLTSGARSSVRGEDSWVKGRELSWVNSFLKSYSCPTKWPSVTTTSLQPTSIFSKITAQPNTPYILLVWLEVTTSWIKRRLPKNKVGLIYYIHPN